MAARTEVRGILLAARAYPGQPGNHGAGEVFQLFLLRNRRGKRQARTRSIPARSIADGRSGGRLHRSRRLSGRRYRCHDGWYDGGGICWRQPCGPTAWRGAEIGRSADDRRRPAPFEERCGYAPRVVGRIVELLLLSRCGLLRRPRRFLLVFVTDFVETDIDHVSVEF